MEIETAASHQVTVRAAGRDGGGPPQGVEVGVTAGYVFVVTVRTPRDEPFVFERAGRAAVHVPYLTVTLWVGAPPEGRVQIEYEGPGYLVTRPTGPYGAQGYLLQSTSTVRGDDLNDLPPEVLSPVIAAIRDADHFAVSGLRDQVRAATVRGP